ncbi:MAG: hypothetical protein NVSMB14_14940 [Isosphaeraceae bacterium]
MIRKTWWLTLAAAALVGCSSSNDSTSTSTGIPQTGKTESGAPTMEKQEPHGQPSSGAKQEEAAEKDMKKKD